MDGLVGGQWSRDGVGVGMELNFPGVSKWAGGERHCNEGSEKTKRMMPD
jgi:hypothetical protein